MAKVATDPGLCQVRSGTDRPCSRQAVLKIRGVPFCEPCAREQETYFAIGELTESSRCLGDGALVQALNGMRWERRTGCIDTAETERAKVAVGDTE